MGDDDFSGMVEQYQRLIYTICYQFVKHHHTAEDLTQETFVSAYQHMASCPRHNLKPWLARIAANKAKDYLKSAYHRRVTAAGEDGLPEDGAALFIQPALPEELAIQQEGALAVTKQIDALKEPYLMVATMYFIEEQTVDEIAVRLNRPAKTVHTQLYRAKKMLRLQLEGGNEDGLV